MKTYNETYNSVFEKFISIEESFDYVPENIEKNVFNKADHLNIEDTFDINEKTYQVDIRIYNDKTAKFLFALISGDDFNPLGITQTGDSHLVFGAVANIFKRFVSEYSDKFKKIIFIGSKKDKNRTRLYDRFVKNSWILSNFDVDIEDDFDVKYYILSKK